MTEAFTQQVLRFEHQGFELKTKTNDNDAKANNFDFNANPPSITVCIYQSPLSAYIKEIR